MSWGIAKTASEIEKIKSESADYLSGLNSCGVIDWNIYNYAFDFYADLLMKAYEQGKKDAQSEPCEDAVSKEAVLDVLRCCYDTEAITYDNGNEYISYDQALDLVDKLPSVTPKRKTGKWIRHPEWQADGECGYECDQCGMGSDVDYDFCMKCGAKMDGNE